MERVAFCEVSEATGGKHVWVPASVVAAAETHAKEQLSEDSSDEDEPMPAQQ